ncbi:MAG: hypothetical protein RLZZ214_3520 [Verrucomicrobiota bacterium]|jgi:hypothetical protein
MNHPVKGYFCLVQYCPDLARREVANVGVLLFSPEHDFLEARLVSDNHRVIRFFGKHADHAKHVTAMKEAFTERMRVEKREFKNLEDLSLFVQTRANRIILTPPKAVRVENPASDLEALFATLVADSIGAAGETEGLELADMPLRKRLDQVLLAPELEPKIRKSVHVRVPVLKKDVEIPFGFQNGRFNLIQPASFAQGSIAKLRDAACRFAVEGDSLYQYTDPILGALQLVIVADFKLTGREGAAAVKELFQEYQVKLYTPETLGDLEQEIRLHGKVLSL